MRVRESQRGGRFHGGVGDGHACFAWAAEQFGTCELKDRRRTARLVKFAEQAALKPDASTPTRAEEWSDTEGAYRLFDSDPVSFEAVTAPHRALTQSQMTAGLRLILNDTTESNFGYGCDIEGLGRVGCEDGRGFFLPTALARNAVTCEVAGVSAQELYKRPIKKVSRVSSAQRKAITSREIDVWGRVIDRVGPPPKGVTFMPVYDRGADNFDVYCHLLTQRSGWVIRAAQLQRRVLDEAGQEQSLDALVAAQPSLGRYELTVTANHKQPARTAQIEVRTAALKMPRPKSGVTPFARQTGLTEIKVRVVEAREVSPVPHGVDPLRGVLLTSEKATTFPHAWAIIEHYKQRPMIEEYYKCLKIGCRVEQRQHRTAKRLEAVIGLICALAARLLQLKLVAHATPNRSASEVVPPRWIDGLRCVLKRPRPLATARDFFRALASLGGVLCRKCDGEPGWQTIWRRLETLLPGLRALNAAQQRCG